MAEKPAASQENPVFVQETRSVAGREASLGSGPDAHRRSIGQVVVQALGIVKGSIGTLLTIESYWRSQRASQAKHLLQSLMGLQSRGRSLATSIGSI